MLSGHVKPKNYLINYPARNLPRPSEQKFPTRWRRQGKQGEDFYLRIIPIL